MKRNTDGMSRYNTNYGGGTPSSTYTHTLAVPRPRSASVLYWTGAVTPAAPSEMQRREPAAIMQGHVHTDLLQPANQQQHLVLAGARWELHPEA